MDVLLQSGSKTAFYRNNHVRSRLDILDALSLAKLSQRRGLAVLQEGANHPLSNNAVRYAEMKQRLP